MNKEYILCAAIHYDNGKVYKSQPINIHTGFVVLGHRHHNCMEIASILSSTVEYPHSGNCGFLTNTNKFLDRSEAYKVAQVYLPNLNNLNHCLYSEDLY